MNPLTSPHHSVSPLLCSLPPHISPLFIWNSCSQPELEGLQMCIFNRNHVWWVVSLSVPSVCWAKPQNALRYYSTSWWWKTTENIHTPWGPYPCLNSISRLHYVYPMRLSWSSSSGVHLLLREWWKNTPCPPWSLPKAIWNSRIPRPQS